MPPAPPAFLRSKSSYIGGGHAGPPDLGSLALDPFWILFRLFSISTPPPAAALAGVNTEIATSAAQTESAKSRIADLPKHLSQGGQSKLSFPRYGTVRATLLGAAYFPGSAKALIDRCVGRGGICPDFAVTIRSICATQGLTLEPYHHEPPHPKTAAETQCGRPPERRAAVSRGRGSAARAAGQQHAVQALWCVCTAREADTGRGAAQGTPK